MPRAEGEQELFLVGVVYQLRRLGQVSRVATD
jgi:hypothetical protein